MKGEFIMKKGKIIASALLAGSIFIGAGYAAWTDQLNINNTVSTGILNVEFIKPHFSPTELSASPYVVIHPVARDAKTVSFTLDNLYPGAAYSTLTEVQNKGTIPVKFANATVSISGDNAVKDNLFVNFDCWIFDKDGNHTGTISPGQSNIPLANLEGVLDSMLANLQLEPGAYITLQGQSIDQYMHFNLSNNAGNDAENKNLTFTITFDWKQFNN